MHFMICLLLCFSNFNLLEFLEKFIDDFIVIYVRKVLEMKFLGMILNANDIVSWSWGNVEVYFGSQSSIENNGLSFKQIENV
jgi:hypothetical protein